MAKRKRSKGKRRGGKRKSKKSRVSKGPGLAVEAGGAITLAEIVINRDAAGYLWRNPKNLATLTASVNAAKRNAMDANTYIPLGVGMLVHWGKNKPVLKIVGKPLDAMAKKYFHKRL